ncbi:MAG: hypothetical protein FWH19_00030 [Treponema sp.]|nr:hypothetical protein [Treponema sp.]
MNSGGLKTPAETAPPQLERGEQRFVARELFRQAAASMGFPKDALSTTLLAFARFFSLSLSPALLGSLRREAIGSPKASLGAEKASLGAEKAAMEAKALALVSALDKGVTLSHQALERYAAYVDPDAGGDSEARRDEGRRDPEARRDNFPTPEELRAAAEEEEQKDELLHLLNRLPGKNGQYWAIFPFKIKIRGIELRVFLRILKKEPVSNSEQLSQDKGDLLIADIIGQKRQWRCFLKKNTAVGQAGKFLADIRVFPQCQPRALKALQREARQLLAEGTGLFGEVLVQNGGEAASWAEELCEECLISINKSV